MGDLPLGDHLLLLCCFFFLLLLVPQNRAIILREHCSCQGQKHALLQLQQESFNSSLWEPETDCCSWEGVTCNLTTGCVIGIDLSSKLLGPIYSNSSLFGFHHLQRLNLAYNDFKLTPIPSGFDRIPSLTHLNLSTTCFSGQIPWEFSHLTSSIGTLTVLDVEGNRFHGMPQQFTNASSLRTLKMNGNILEGKVPRSLANCTSLEVLDLGKNKIFDTFPFWLGKLPMLRVLVLHSNRFYGSIEQPQALVEFPMLQIMDLSSNRFTGNLPAEYFRSLGASMLKNGHKPKLEYIGDCYYKDSVTIMNKRQEMKLVRILTIYTAIDLSNNSFQGEIPKAIGDLISLVLLNLSHNDLTGLIPSSIGKMAELESLDLSQNKLSGQIPLQLTSLTFLEFLNLTQNHLEGPIPQGHQLDTFSNSSYIENPELCGLPLSRKCKVISDDMLPQGDKSKSTNDFKSDWKFMLMGYGCGMIIGIVIGYFIFKDEWIIRTFRVAPIRPQKKSKTRRLRR
ncbi:receptor-like protein 33 [Macadamia integrifolia]|uniref:receptor-like protein 33 n=1 Tax=Macadamia integrifolia TaxID=60698 RepID=UPI001C4F0CA0|nr:receptor-like protein 33 [Macadamia integrifolia]